MLEEVQLAPGKILLIFLLSTLSLLKKMGLSNKAKVELNGRGDAKPVADNKTSEGRNENGHVGLTFTPE